VFSGIDPSVQIVHRVERQHHRFIEQLIGGAFFNGRRELVFQAALHARVVPANAEPPAHEAERHGVEQRLGHAAVPASRAQV